MQKLNSFVKFFYSISRLTFVLFSFLTFQLSAQVIPSDLLKSISDYNIGDDRGTLTEINEIVVDALNNEQKRSSVEQQLIQFFKTDITFDAKQFLSRQLRIIGTEKTVLALNEFITNDELSDLVRYAIEEIENQEVDNILVEALPKASTKIQIGIINSLGFRKSENAVEPISNLIRDDNSILSISAASALGKIGNEKCILSLDKYLNVNNVQLRNVVFDSYLLCVDNLFKTQKFEKAYIEYNKIYQSKNSNYSVKQAALIGIINSSINKEDEIFSRIKNEPDEFKSIPISKIRDIKNINDINKFAELLDELSPANQIKLLSIFEELKNVQVKPFILKLLNSDVELVRIAVIKTLANIGDKSDVKILARIAANKSGIEAEAAQNSLNLLNNENVDDEIISDINSAEDNIKIVLISSVGTRGISSSLNQMLTLTSSENRLVRNEAFKTIGEIASINDVDKLIDILKLQKDNSDKRKVEYTISTIIKKYEQTNNTALTLVSSFKGSSNVNDKVSFLRLMGQTENEAAYNKLVEELKNDNTEIKIAAISGLSLWQNSEPRGLLLNIAQNSIGDVQRAAVKGFTNFIEMDNQLTNQQKVELYKKSLELSKTSNEKNIALDAIGHLDTFESLEIIKNYINQSDVKETVEDGINRVSWHLFPSDPEKVKEYVKYFLSEIKDEYFQTKNNELLEAIDRFVERNK